MKSIVLYFRTIKIQNEMKNPSKIVAKYILKCSEQITLIIRSNLVTVYLGRNYSIPTPTTPMDCGELRIILLGNY